MHGALGLPEILAAVLEHCSPASLGRAATVCRTWEKVANAILWRNVSTVWNFIRVLGPMEEGDRGMNFTHPFKSKNWDRFLHHAHRVQELDYDYASKGQKILSSDTLTILASTRPTVDLCPNLSRLVWVIVDDIHFAYAMIFMHKHLKKLHLIILPDVTTAALRDFIECLPSRCPELTDLDISAGIRISALEPVLSNSLAALPFLEEVSFPAFGITTTILHALSRHRHLKKMYARPFWGLGFTGAADDVKSVDVDDLPEGSFPELQELDLDGGFDVLYRVLAAPCIPRTLTRLYFSAFDGEPLAFLRHLLDFIAREFTELTFLGLAYLIKPTEHDGGAVPGLGAGADAADGAVANGDDNIPRITFDILRPALKLRKLKNFHVMHNRPLRLDEADIDEMGAAWGDGPLRCLRLVPDPVFNPHTPMESDLTLGSLAKFAQCLPKLERLEVYIDATRDLPTSPPTHVFKSLHTLDVGISPITQPDHGAVARWIAELVPRGGMSLLYGADWSLAWAELSFAVDMEYLLPRRNYWQRVGEMHTQLCIAAEDHRKRLHEVEEVKLSSEERIRQLEEELRTLKVSQSPAASIQSDPDSTLHLHPY